MIISLIVAVDEDWGIGLKNQIPWRLSHDLKRFKQLTMGHHLLMGRKTYESIGYPLPGRTSIVITHQKSFPTPDEFTGKVLTAPSFLDGLHMAERRGENELFIIGGGQIYAQAHSRADCIYLTRVHAHCYCDTLFPVLAPEDWIEVHHEDHPADAKNQFSTTFSILRRAEAQQ
jgi:dihydrofolate reductase